MKNELIYQSPITGRKILVEDSIKRWKVIEVVSHIAKMSRNYLRYYLPDVNFDVIERLNRNPVSFTLRVYIGSETDYLEGLDDIEE